MFQFKQFSIEDNLSTMKVGTDAVLLGAWVDCSNTADILEIGSGSGVIALMLAQRSSARILGVDIHPDSVLQARSNADKTPWKQRVEFQCADIVDFSRKAEQKFDLIVSNPPFFEHSLLSPKEERNMSRHTNTLSFGDLLNSVRQLLTADGNFSLIVPIDAAESIVRQSGMYVTRWCEVIPKKGKNAHRCMLTFSFSPSKTEKSSITIRTENGDYSTEYRQLTQDFYLKL